VAAAIKILPEKMEGTMRVGLVVGGERLPKGDKVALNSSDLIQFGVKDECRMRFTRLPLKICTSGIKDKAVTTSIKQSAAKLSTGLASEYDEAVTHLIVSEIDVTAKVLQAMVYGHQIVSPAWLEELVSRQLTDPLPDPGLHRPLLLKKSLKKYESRMTIAPDQKRRHIFQDTTVVCLEQRDKTTYERIVEIAGGVMRLSANEADDDAVITELSDDSQPVVVLIRNDKNAGGKNAARSNRFKEAGMQAVSEWGIWERICMPGRDWSERPAATQQMTQMSQAEPVSEAPARAAPVAVTETEDASEPLGDTEDSGNKLALAPPVRMRTALSDVAAVSSPGEQRPAHAGGKSAVMSSTTGLHAGSKTSAAKPTRQPSRHSSQALGQVKEEALKVEEAGAASIAHEPEPPAADASPPRATRSGRSSITPAAQLKGGVGAGMASDAEAQLKEALEKQRRSNRKTRGSPKRASPEAPPAVQEEEPEVEPEEPSPLKRSRKGQATSPPSKAVEAPKAAPRAKRGRAVAEKESVPEPQEAEPEADLERAEEEEEEEVVVVPAKRRKKAAAVEEPAAEARVEAPVEQPVGSGTMQVLDRRSVNKQPRQPANPGGGINFKKFRKNQIGKVASLSEVIEYKDGREEAAPRRGGATGGHGAHPDRADAAADADFDATTAKQSKRRR